MAKKQTSLPRSMRTRTKSQPTQRKIPFWAWIAVGTILSIALVAGLFYLGLQGAAPAASGDLLSSNAFSADEIEGLVVFPDPGATHLNGDIEYAQEVPPGGPHNPVWQNCGIYDQPVRTENVVHSLEHGAVWIAYQADLPDDQVEILRELVRQERGNRRQPLIVLAPKPDLSVPIVMTAWRAQLELDDASDERLALFVSRFQKGPFTPEPGASCTGGIGSPRS